MKLTTRIWSLRLPLAAAALSVGMLGNLTGCVSNDEYRQLHTSFDQSQAQLAEAENDLAKARARIAELEGQMAELSKLNGGQGLDALQRDRDLLAARLAELQTKYDELLAMNGGTPALPADVNAALRDLALKYPDLLEFDERLGMLRLKSDLTFDVGSTEVKPRAKEALAKVAQIFDMPEIAKNEIQVMGHTDDIPVRASTTMRMNPSNEILSTNRAWAVAEVLHVDGVGDNRLMAAGWGEQRPVAPNAAGKKGNEKNRRVDIYVRPTTVPEGIVVSTPGAPGSSTPRPAPAPRRTTPARGGAGATTRPAPAAPATGGTLAPALPG